MVLRNLLDEGPVVEPVNLFDFPVLIGNLENQRHLPIHNLGGSCFELAWRRSSRSEISDTRFRRGAISTIPARIEQPATSATPRPNNKLAKGRQAKANRPGRTGLRITAKAPKNNSTNDAANFQSKISNAPNEVAMPFPPRKRNWTGHRCPVTTPSMASAKSRSSVVNWRAPHTATMPLPKSHNMVARNPCRPSNRPTFLAPTLPLPTSRTSCPVRQRTR